MSESARNLPKITLITVVRNGAATLERCLESVVAQDYPNLEYIVLDGGSTDGSQDVIARYRDHIAYYRSAPDGSPYAAITEGFALATGDIVGLLHADDWLAPNALGVIGELGRQTPEAELFCFGMQHQHQEGGIIRPGLIYRDPPGTHLDIEGGLYCQGVNRFYAASLLKREGTFDKATYKELADREFYVRLGFAGVRKAVSQEILYHFRVHPGSNSTGGSRVKIARFLDETIAVAEIYLKTRTDLDARARNLLEDWICFNVIRSVYFKLRSGAGAAALQQAVATFTRFPLRLVRNAIHWRMPEAYRGSAS